MKYTLLLISSLFIFASCWRKETPKSFIRPVQLVEATSLDSYSKDFVGVVSAEQYTNLAFQVGGLVDHIFVNEGSYVKKGQILAQLDPQDYAVQLEADKAQYQSSKSILERNERLLSRQAISTQDVEIARANFQKAKSAYDYSLNQLEYTRLRAPFSGSIETKFVEDFQKIAAGEKIFKLINPAVLDVKFTLPETNISLTQMSAQYFILFENLKGRSFKAKIKEVVDASVGGMGIPVTLSITDPAFDPVKEGIKAGFACTVKVLLDKRPGFRNYVNVPVAAIFSENEADPNQYVWVYNPTSGTVSKRAVTTNGLMGNNEVIVSQGITPGEQVVSAGVYQLVDNQKVTVLK